MTSSSSHHFLSSRESFDRRQQHNIDNVRSFSALAQDFDGDGGDGGHQKPSSLLLPTSHSRNLPPPVCPPTQLRSEVESIFDAPIGSLIVYSKSELGNELKSAEEEMADAYYASDAAVQRVEYIMRGLNAAISDETFVSRSVKKGDMAFEEEAIGGNGDGMAKEDCFRAMLDLLERMTKEGEAYAELRTRVRSQLADPEATKAAAEDSDSSSSSDDSDSSDSDSDDEDSEVVEHADKEFSQWAQSMEESMSKAGFATRNSAASSASGENDEDEEVSEEMFQFGSDPGVTIHMFDMLLDSLACLCQEQYGKGGATSTADLVELMPEEAPSPPELAKDMLDVVLNRHWMDGGDIGLGNGGSQNAMTTIAQGIGIGAGTGAGALAGIHGTTFDIRTCPTPMTFNAVIRVAANFDPAAYATAVENAKVLSGDMGNTSGSAGSANSANSLKQEQERLRDVTIDAALSTYSRMQHCSALTLRTLKNTTKKATSRSSLKRQARLLADTYKGKEKNTISGRNSASYAYLIQTLSNCIPPSLSRGNMTFGLYHKGCVMEGVMDERLVEVMRGVGGYGDDADEGSDENPMPPVSNGPIFDSFMQKELGGGVKTALEKGMKLRQCRNYKMRRHVEWDDTY